MDDKLQTEEELLAEIVQLQDQVEAAEDQIDKLITQRDMWRRRCHGISIAGPSKVIFARNCAFFADAESAAAALVDE